MINLRTLSLADGGGAHTQTQTRSHFSGVGFRVPETLLGNIGESLDHGESYVSTVDDTDLATERKAEVPV